jgi:hypothetical protein
MPFTSFGRMPKPAMSAKLSRAKLSRLTVSHVALLLAVLLGLAASAAAGAASCTTQAQMSSTQRDSIVGSAKALASQVQSGDVQGIRAQTLPAVASDFSGIQQSVQYITPLIQRATITVSALYLLDASTDPPNAQRTDFFCGSPVVGFNFTGLPPGIYAIVMLHATGVPQPQHISLILAKTAENKWLLAGFFNKPMVLAGHDGAWYWQTARKFAQDNQKWGAWFYYRIATDLLDPVGFIASPNLEKLRHETDQVHADLPAPTGPLSISVNGSIYQVVSVETTTALGPLDLEVHYKPDPNQAAALRSPVVARKQVSDLMAALLISHPELRSAFQGMWLHADEGNASLFALELPMSASTPGAQLTPAGSSSTAHP